MCAVSSPRAEKDHVVPGRGTLDYDLFLTRFDFLCPDGYFIIEHLPHNLIPEARAFVAAAAQRLGLNMLVRASLGNAFSTTIDTNCLPVTSLPSKPCGSKQCMSCSSLN